MAVEARGGAGQVAEGGVSARTLDIAALVAAENVPHMPDPAERQRYAERHGDRSQIGWKELSDVQVASRGRMLMRDDWTHEAVCTAVRDRICCLVIEKQALIAALASFVDGDSGDDIDERYENARSVLAKIRGEA